VYRRRRLAKSGVREVDAMDGRLQHGLGFEAISARIGDYRLQAGVGRWNADLQVVFGSSNPGANQHREAQDSLDRLMLPKS
jgi:hypothetical protein